MAFKADITPGYIVDYRVAKRLNDYGYGYMLISKFLERGPTQIDGWLRDSNKLSGINYDRAKVRKKIEDIKGYVTCQEINFFLVKEVQKSKIPLSDPCLSELLEEPEEVIAGWRHGATPVLVKKNFVDRDMVVEKFEDLLINVREEYTKSRIKYYLALELHERIKKKYPSGKVGSRIISRILKEYFREKTTETAVHYWLHICDNDYYVQLKDSQIVKKEMKNIEEMLTVDNLDYYVALELDARNMPVGKIAKSLGFTNTEKFYFKLYFWKHRGNALVKTFKDKEIVSKAADLILSGNPYKDIKQYFKRYLQSKHSDGFCPNCRRLMTYTSDIIGTYVTCKFCAGKKHK